MADNEMDAEGANDLSGESKPTSAALKRQAIEKTYQKKSQLEHILLRPDTYIGSVEKVQETMWVYNMETEQMEHREIEYVPGLYKIFDEILVNAADNKQRDKSMDCIKVEIDPDENVISVWNNGQGIPVVMHKDENMFVPTMIFGHLLTSSNYNDEEEKVTGGRNGYGAKLCNIFSTKFTVETSSKEYKNQFKQTWGSNMSKASEPKIKSSTGGDFTKITFSPDLSKFKMEKLDNDIVSLMARRAFDVAASTRGVKVYLNGVKLPVKNFKDYVELFVKRKTDDGGQPLKVIHEICGERWEVAMTLSEQGFQQISFVNSIATTKGGRHVDYVTDMIVKHLLEAIKKKNKGGVSIKPFQVKAHMWIFINCLIVNPTFDSQTKEHMTLQVKNFGSKCVMPEKFLNQVAKSGIIESVLTWAKFKAQTELTKKDGKKHSKLRGIPKLEDANEAGTKNSHKCTLILTEGDSAKSTVMAGLGVVGRDYYGIFPLRGKLLNVREATHKQILENAEINNIIKILGLQYKKKYNNVDDMKSLRYGKVMIMTDQDQDGSHIKGLLINFIHHNWPELLKMNFLEQFITPIVKARKNKEVLSFYSLPEFEEWRSNTPNHKSYNIKYYKGLGTSDAKEGKEYFSDMARHRIKFHYQGQMDDDHILLAFSKKHVDLRKEWLTNFMVESRRRKEIGLPEAYLYGKNTIRINYTDFINMELVLFSNGDNIRSIPSMMDGFKPAQRKVLYVCIKRNDKREVKVGQLVGSVMEKAAYHHGDASLSMTIVSMAQNFVGSNNINLLEPRGQFGTRLTGGKDSASPRYIFTKMSPLARKIFHPLDDPLLKHDYDDNVKIEPFWYCPIVPMVLVNGADGIGTGWMTKIPNFNPRDIVDRIRKIMDGEEPKHLAPWYKNFKGSIEYAGDQRFVVYGEISILGPDQVEITELPVGVWTQTYKENVLEPMLNGTEKVKAVISDYKDYSTDITVKFIVTLLDGQLEALEKEGLHKAFKLHNFLNLSSMHAFDEYGCLKRYDSALDILREFYKVRLRLYEERKEYLLNMLEAEAKKLTNQAKFIVEKCDGSLRVENKKRKTIVTELISRGYDPDPVKEWKDNVAKMGIGEDEETPPEEEDTESTTGAVTSEKSVVALQKYDYLLGMSMWMLTEERKNELLRQRDNKLLELTTLRKKEPIDLWRSDLDAFVEELDKIEKKEQEDDAIDYNKEKSKGKKRVNVAIMPSPVAQRVVPVITEEMKKKIQSAVKAKERKVQGVKKEDIAEANEPDEFSEFLKNNKKTLKEKIGNSPEAIENKLKKKKGKDGMKQTTLNFMKVNGSPKKRGAKQKMSSSDEDEDIECIEVTSKPRVLSRRNATKVTKYNMFDDDDDDDDFVSMPKAALDDSEPETPIAEKKPTKKAGPLSSDEEENKPPENLKSSEDMFDVLVGRKKLEENSTTNGNAEKKRKSYSSDSDMFDNDDKPGTSAKTAMATAAPPEEKKNRKKPIAKKAKPSEDEESPVVRKPAKGRRKKAVSSDDDEDFKIADSDDEPPKVVKKPQGRSRAVNTVKYTFSSDDDD